MRSQRRRLRLRLGLVGAALSGAVDVDGCWEDSVGCLSRALRILGARTECVVFKAAQQLDCRGHLSLKHLIP